MLRRLGAAALFVGLVSAEDKDDTWLPTDKSSQEYSCGNCYKHLEFAPNALCNTGMKWTGGDDPFYYRDGVAGANVTGFSVAPARGLTVARIQELVGDEWKFMNCKNYLSRYTNGFVNGGAGSGAACVRAPTKDAILQADAEVLTHFKKFGTSNGMAWGYPSSYASPGSTPEDVALFGSGRGGDVPANWCRSYMMDMLCHVAFPQVVGTVNNDATNGDQYYFGRIRAVDEDSCTSILGACLRRQPPDDETSGDFVPLEMRHRTAGAWSVGPLMSTAAQPDQRQFVQYDLPAESMSMEVPKYCELWKGGWGLARAGTGVASEDGYFAGVEVVKWPANSGKTNNEWTHAEFEASSTTAASLLFAAAAVVATIV